MINFKRLQPFTNAILRSAPIAWRNRDFLILGWLLYLQLIVPGKKTKTEIARKGPRFLTESKISRFLKASYWSIHTMMTWLSDAVVAQYPPAKDGIIRLVVDGSHKTKSGKKNDLVQKGKTSHNKPYFWGIRFVLLIVAWDVYRIPVAFRIVLPKKHKYYRKENVLFRDMVAEYTPPAWAQKIIVIGDAAYSSKDNITMIKNRNKIDERHEWYFVFALAKSAKCHDGKAVKDLVFHLPKSLYKRHWISPIVKTRKRKSYWTFKKNIILRDVGEVTVLLSKKRRNAGPKSVKLIVTNLPTTTERQILDEYQRRWPIEIVFKELKSGLGLGEYQGVRNERVTENSFGIALLAYLFLLRVSKDKICKGRSWSIFQLQREFQIDAITYEIQRDTELRIYKISKAA